ncbi:uncharacterized protein LOC144651980 [Oculina patagonica]
MAANQHDRDVSMVSDVLELQSILKKVSEGVRIDYFEVASEESMDQLLKFYELITPSPDREQPLQEQLLEASEHIVNFLEGSPKPVMETTYKALNDLMSAIKSRNYFCPSCLAVYNPDKVHEDSYVLSNVNDSLLDICDLGPLGAYGMGGIGDANLKCTATCPKCNDLITLNVVATATPVYDNLDSMSDKMPSVDYFEDAVIKAVLSRDTSNEATDSLMDGFVYYDDYDESLPSVGEYDFTEETLNLWIIVKTRMNNGYCFIGLDMKDGGLVRPILRTATNQCCWRITDPVLDVGQQHCFQVYSRHLKEIPFPHKNNDVLVGYLGSISSEEINIFDLLNAQSFDRVEDVFTGAHIKDGRYVIEGAVCPSAGVYRCIGKNLTLFDIKYRDGNIKKRCKIIEGNATFVLPITALQPYSPTNKDVLVILGLARPFKGYTGQEYTPKRCAILVLGIIPRPN